MGRHLQSHSENFFTEDYTILNLDDESRKGQRSALIVQDGCSYWVQNYPTKQQRRARNSILLGEISAFIPGARESLHRQFRKEFMKACPYLQWTHLRNTPHRSDTNKIAERVVRRVNAGTPTARVPSGLPEEWWDCDELLLLRAGCARQGGRWQGQRTTKCLV